MDKAEFEGGEHQSILGEYVFKKIKEHFFADTFFAGKCDTVTENWKIQLGKGKTCKLSGHCLGMLNAIAWREQKTVWASRFRKKGKYVNGRRKAKSK